MWCSRSLSRAGAPANTFYGNGLLGQRVIVVPDQDLVIVRLGLNLNNDFDPVRIFCGAWLRVAVHAQPLACIPCSLPNW